MGRMNVRKSSRGASASKKAAGRRVIGAAMIVVGGAMCDLATAGDFAFTRVAKEGQEAPDGNGVVTDFWREPVINASGQVGFVCLFRDTLDGIRDDEGLMLWDGEKLRVAIREGDAAPDGNGVYGSLFPGMIPPFEKPAINDAGELVTLAGFREFVDGADTGIVRADGEVVQIVRLGDLTPDATARFVGYIGGIEPSNQLGETAFYFDTLQLEDSAGDVVERGVWFGKRNQLRKLLEVNDPSPDGDGVIEAFHEAWSSISDNGMAIFKGEIRPDNGGALDSGLFYATSEEVLLLAREGDPAVGGGTWVQFATAGSARASMNASGQFTLQLGRLQDAFAQWSLYRGDANGLELITAWGHPLPEGSGTFYSFLDPQINSAGDIATLAAIDTDGVMGIDATGVYRTEGEALVTVVQHGNRLPGGSGGEDGVDIVENIGLPQFNDEGTVAVVVSLLNEPLGVGSVVYRKAGAPAQTLIRSGDLLDGQIVSSATMTFLSDNGGRAQLNNAGDLVVRVYFEDEDAFPPFPQGIYVASPCAAGDHVDDLNRDGVVNGADIGRFFECSSGPVESTDLGCECADVDDDGDVDFADFGAFQAAFAP